MMCFCEDDAYAVSGATADGYSALQWTSAGDGAFSGSATLNPQYTPGPQDKAAGEVTLFLEAFTDAPCEGTFTDSRTLTITPAPQVEAGDNGALCQNETFQILNSNLVNYDQLQLEHQRRRHLCGHAGTLTRNTSPERSMAKTAAPRLR
ncbi:MAG: hypothetical protein U5L09_07165 [Bacteroidales bacterium]|nr:hypothetical protein [Bacteroidales bacterium]